MLYQHIDPALVGNDMRMLVSRHGRPGVGRDQGPRARLRPVRRQGDSGGSSSGSRTWRPAGYTFEAADASFELLLRDELAGGERGRVTSTVESWRVIVERRPGGEVVSEATVKLHAKGERIVATGEGNGPVNALDTRAAARPSDGSTRSWPGSSWPTTRSASSRARTAPARVTRVLIDLRRRPAGEWEHGRRATRTSSPPPGRRWRRRSRTASSAPATSPVTTGRPRRREHSAGAGARPAPSERSAVTDARSRDAGGRRAVPCGGPLRSEARCRPRSSKAAMVTTCIHVDGQRRQRGARRGAGSDVANSGGWYCWLATTSRVPVLWSARAGKLAQQRCGCRAFWRPP